MTKRLFVAIIITIGLILLANRAAFGEVYYYEMHNDEWTSKQQRTYEEFSKWTQDNKYRMTFDAAGSLAVYKPDNSLYWRLIREDAWLFIKDHPIPEDHQFTYLALFHERNDPYKPD